jgi:hypothetical protein
MKIKVDLRLDQSVSTHLSFVFILILSFLVSWFTLSKAQEIISNAKDAAAFNIQTTFPQEKQKMK